ncbi:hypothetical protein M3G91_29785 [Micromonospora chalcea]|uniref:hypothetical protein n=1 Tax=Micromonospora chalcea TaxID=1874 RepID=UPI0021A87546|nr:hypothetical protein [Micromonospora chalcea]MCT2281794.1 hypothetical protein [Micromonospora chalcea]
MSDSRTRRRRTLEKKRTRRAGNSSQAKRQPRRYRRRSIGPAIKTVYRTSRLLRPDMRVRYAADVAEGSIDREAWAKVILQLIDEETEGNKSRFATLVGVTYKTVLRWTQRASDVSEDSVRQVARALHISPLALLVRVGYYTEADLQAAAAATEDAGHAIPAGLDRDDPALRVILEADVPPRVQQRMIQRLQQMRQREAERQVDEVRWWIDQSRGA